MTLLAINFSVYLLLITTVKYYEAAECGLNPVSCPTITRKYRTYDGTCNNLNKPGMGSINKPYLRGFGNPNYKDGISKKPVAVSGKPLPNARKISEKTAKQIPKVGSSKVRNIGGYHQFIAHDISFTQIRSFTTPCCTVDMKPLATTPDTCDNIVIPDDDSDYSEYGATCMPKPKTTTTLDLGCTASFERPWADQITSVTPALDLDGLYAQTKEANAALRSLEGGKMIVRMVENAEYLPNKTQGCSIPKNSLAFCYITGEIRSNQNIDLIINHIVWIRFHNWCCTIMATINPHWNDERLFQECRKINIAVHQYLSFSELFPAVIGYKAMYERNLLYPYNSLNGRSKYNDTCELAALNEFSNGAYRILHAIIVDCLKMANEKRESLGHLKLSDNLNKPSIIEQNNNFDNLLRGGTCQRAAQVGPSFDSIVTSRLKFSLSPYIFGIDLRATDIERAREHGIATYNAIRKQCGLKGLTSFDDLADVMTQESIETLEETYEHFEDIDYIVGASFETPVPGALVGPSVVCVFLEAIERLQKCDRYWFDNDQGHFTDLQVLAIRSMSVASLLCLTGDSIEYMQPNAVEPPHAILNPLIPCLLQPPMSLEPWKEINFP